MKERIIEIVEFGQPQSLIQRGNAPITELIKTDLLIEELNEQLRLYWVSNSAYFSKVCKWCKSTKTHYDYVTIEGGEIWQCDDCKQEFLEAH